jgi:FtsP/CotA-like multicopper oxidase with cupredoxin domain
MRHAVVLAAASLLVAGSLPRSDPGRRAVERAAINDNRSRAGTLRNGVLSIDLDVREVEWHPDADDAPGIRVLAFAERGKRGSVPGPLIRVPEGTVIRASVRNTQQVGAVMVRGLSAHGASRRPADDSLQVGPGQTRRIEFTADAVGTYYYTGTLVEPPKEATLDAELSGAFVVDRRGALPVANDRVLVIALWTRTPRGGIINRPDVLRFTINGKSWPNTEHLSYAVGDTVRFRMINASIAPHPMHLHGFYFDVNSRGDGVTDSLFSARVSTPRVVTERVAPGRTTVMTWVPERAGNWLFHCHDNFHTLRNAAFDGTPLVAERLMHAKNHAREMMGGLVMGIEVRGGDAQRVEVPDAARRRLRLVAQQDSGGTDVNPAYGYVLHDGATATPTSSPLLPGPTIMLERGKPVSITVVNHLREPTAVHWHGIELESYFDGVADFSGMGKRLTPAIAPGDSFVARFTPPRSGTFMYHPHADETRQQQAGLAGTLLVVDSLPTFDPAHDRVLLITVPRSDDDGNRVLINGRLEPDTLRLRAGERYRLRIVDLHTYRPSMVMRLLRDSTLVTWRPVAKDAMPLAPDRATIRRAIQQMGNGETYDFEIAPAEPTTLRFTVSAAVGTLLAEMPVVVR